MTVTFQKQILLCSILLALPACSLARAEKTEPLPVAERQVVYKTVGDVELVMHIFVYQQAILVSPQSAPSSRIVVRELSPKAHNTVG